MMRVVSKIRRNREQAYGTWNAWNAICKQVIERDRGRCRNCGISAKDAREQGLSMDVHHIIPTSRGGQTVLANLKYLCSDCHERQPFHKHLARRK